MINNKRKREKRKRMEEKMRNKQKLLDDIENLIYCKVNLGYNQIFLGV
jgi:hypothetical protein